MFEPRLLLMDEPLGALDRKLRESLQLEIIRVSRELGATVLYVTHDQEEALVMSDRIAIFSDGRIEQLGTGEDLYDRPASLFVADFIGESNILRGRYEVDGGDGGWMTRGEARWRVGGRPRQRADARVRSGGGAGRAARADAHPGRGAGQPTASNIDRRHRRRGPLPRARHQVPARARRRPADLDPRTTRVDGRELQRGDQVRLGWSVDDGLLVADPGERLTRRQSEHIVLLVSSLLSGRPWVMRMRWRDLLFAHWVVDPAALRPLVPSSLVIDTFEGRAYLGVVPFGMEDVAPRGLPAVPYLSVFPEVNVRTYVRDGERSGVWFFSLDAGRRLGSKARGWGSTCRISMRGCRWCGTATPSCTARRGSIDAGVPPSSMSAIGRPARRGRHRQARSTGWLTDRLRLFAVDGRGRVSSASIAHAAWPLRPAEAEFRVETMSSAQGLELSGPPVHLAFADRLDVRAWWPRRVGHGWRPAERPSQAGSGRSFTGDRNVSPSAAQVAIRRLTRHPTHVLPGSGTRGAITVPG